MQTLINDSDSFADITASIIPRPSQVIVIQQGGSGLFDCPFVGSPQPILVYYRNNEVLNISSSKYEIFGNGTLKIIKATNRDQGSYDCRIRVLTPSNPNSNVFLRSNISRIIIYGKICN